MNNIVLLKQFCDLMIIDNLRIIVVCRYKAKILKSRKNRSARSLKQSCF